jgi:nicotinate-nucleotide--dimethylbenzimidazole phosphoribosyltransferase
MNNKTLQEELQHKINFKTKPIGALGLLEEVALQVGSIQNTLSPCINKPHIVVFAADHGIAATGSVNPYPQAVTAQMVLNFVQGGAAINVFCKQNKIELTVVDAGVNFDFETTSKIWNSKIAKGTKNYLEEPAMNMLQCNEAIDHGEKIVATIFEQGCNCIGFGEMGIGNTSAASLIMSVLLQMPLHECVGRGTGVNDEQLKIKIDTLQKVFTFHQLSTLQTNPLQLLSTIGGFEIAMMVGAFLKASELNMVIVVDGFIATAALLLARELYKNSASKSPLRRDLEGLCIFAHTSGEQGHVKMLQYLSAKPLLQLGMKLGEGTGAAMAMPIIQSAVNFLNEMASFETSGVSNKE